MMEGTYRRMLAVLLVAMCASSVIADGAYAQERPSQLSITLNPSATDIAHATINSETELEISVTNNGAERAERVEVALTGLPPNDVARVTYTVPEADSDLDNRPLTWRGLDLNGKAEGQPPVKIKVRYILQDVPVPNPFQLTVKAVERHAHTPAEATTQITADGSAFDADLALSIKVRPDEVKKGDPYVVIVNVENRGTDTVEDIVVKLSRGPDTDIAITKTEPPAASLNNTDGYVVWDNIKLTAGYDRDYMIWVTQLSYSCFRYSAVASVRGFVTAPVYATLDVEPPPPPPPTPPPPPPAAFAVFEVEASAATVAIGSEFKVAVHIRSNAAEGSIAVVLMAPDSRRRELAQKKNSANRKDQYEASAAVVLVPRSPRPTGWQYAGNDVRWPSLNITQGQQLTTSATYRATRGGTYTFTARLTYDGVTYTSTTTVNVVRTVSPLQVLFKNKGDDHRESVDPGEEYELEFAVRNPTRQDINGIMAALRYDNSKVVILEATEGYADQQSSLLWRRAFSLDSKDARKFKVKYRVVSASRGIVVFTAGATIDGGNGGTTTTQLSLDIKTGAWTK